MSPGSQLTFRTTGHEPRHRPNPAESAARSVRDHHGHELRPRPPDAPLPTLHDRPVDEHLALQRGEREPVCQLPTKGHAPPQDRWQELPRSGSTAQKARGIRHAHTPLDPDREHPQAPGDSARHTVVWFPEYARGAFPDGAPVRGADTDIHDVHSLPIWRDARVGVGGRPLDRLTPPLMLIFARASQGAN
ncbi:hypothetical protein D9M71_628920 [compost metagenome]